MKAKRQPVRPEDERQDRMVMIGGVEILWSKHWDDPDDYGIDEEREELDGFRVGERVQACGDIDEGGYCLAADGDQGIVIGITHPHPGGGMFNNPSRPAELCIGWDDLDPTSVPTYVVEKV